MPAITKFVFWILVSLGFLTVLLIILVRLTTFHPARVQAEAVHCAGEAPTLKPGQHFKVMTYNIQYMAGKNYVFFYDLPDNSGPDERPTPEDVTKTLAEVARIIQDKDPDIILLQEVDDGAARTGYEDQLARLLDLLPAGYVCHTSAFYWRAAFVPHPRIRGAVGHKLSIISKYHLQESTRYQLPIADTNLITQQFNYKRAILETHLPVKGGQDLVVLTTHLEVSSQGADIKQHEMAALNERLAALNRAGYPWLLGGDFNLLLPGQINHLPEIHRRDFRPETELALLLDRYRVIPSLADLQGDGAQKWFTMFPNDPTITEPDRTVDYIFYADNLTLNIHYVRQHDTLSISDHLPLVAGFNLP
jgi:endonuclease/exonuclease/phosphatase family metal-dependent hydrolase